MGLDVARRPWVSTGRESSRIAAFQHPGHGGYNPYVDILRGSLQGVGFDFDRAHRVGDGPRIALLHWTENHWLNSASSATSRIRSSIIRRGLPLFLMTLRTRGFRVVWFAHNCTPHDWHGSTEEWFAQAHGFYRHVDAVAHLTTASTLLPEFGRFQDLPHTVVRHPHYELVDPATHAGHARSITRLLMLGGASQRRKNAGQAAQTIQNIPNLRIVITGDLDPELDCGFTSSPNVDFIPGMLAEKELFALFDGSTAVLLNQQSQLNSGCMFLGLSRGAPVICPDTPANRETRSLVGAEWIRLFEAPLSAEKLAALVKDPVPAQLPDLTAFRPDLLAKGFRDWAADDLLHSDSSHRRTES
jgi:beta-1,4-mannosyltransferase